MNQENFVKSIKSYQRLPARKVDGSGYRIVSVRLREGEFISFAEQVRALGLTNNLALRIAARRIAGFLEIDPETRLTLKDISRNIERVSDSLGQIGIAAMRERKVDMELFQKERAALAMEIMRLDGFVHILLNVSLRRQDGRSLVEKAATMAVLD